MNSLLIAVSLVASGTAASRSDAGADAAIEITKSQPTPGESVREMGEWGQRLVAAQQPAIDAFQRCNPLVQQMIAAIRSYDAGEEREMDAFLPAVRSCMADAKAAALSTRDLLAAMEPMPSYAEQALRLDSRDILRRTANSTGEMAVFIDLVEAAIEDLLAGKPEQAQRKWAQAMRSAGGVIDAQIVILETVRANLPLDTHRAMADIRINISRAVRLITVAEDGDPQAPPALRRYGAEQRAATARMKSHWEREFPMVRSALAVHGAAARTTLLAAADKAMKAIMRCGDDSVALLEAARDDGGEAQLIEIGNELAAIDIRILEAVREMSTSLSRTN